MIKNIIGLTHLQPYGLNMYGYDTSAVLCRDGGIVTASAEERFTRNKHHAGFPWLSLNHIFNYNNIYYEDIDLIAIPWPLELKRPLHWKFATNLIDALRPATRAALQAKKRLFLPVEKIKVVGVSHHTAHAASAYRCSGFNKAMVVTLDQGGSEKDIYSSCGGIFIGENGELKRRKIFTSGSLGTFYSFITQGLGFQVGDAEWKVMGLAAYADTKVTDIVYEKIKPYAPRFRDGELYDGAKKIHGALFEMNNVLRFVFDEASAIEPLARKYKRENVAAAAQRLTEELIVQIVEYYHDEIGIDRLCLAGGVFMNVKVNKRLRELSFIKDLFIYPNAGDGGGTAGACLEAWHRITGKKTVCRLNHAYLGPDFTNEEIEAQLKKHNWLDYERVEDIAGAAAEMINNNKIIGWFQGKMEWGPRALGARSVLCSPSDIKIKDKLNLKLKQRDWFMPFAPSMLYEKMSKYVINPCESPFMIMAFDIINEAQDEIKAVTHVDGTARIQSVTKQYNGIYYDLLKKYEKLTGTGAVLNTSFNKHGLPIVCTPEDAIQHLKMNCVEYLAIGDYIVKKNIA